MNDKPNEILIDRVVVIWKRLLGQPEYDNGDKGINGVLASGLASSLPNNSTPELFNKFGVELKKQLMEPNENGYYNRDTSVDYGPCKALADSAEAVGLKMQFPWKTNVTFWDKCVNVRAGYSAPCKHHYPMPDGRWLITTLSGDEIDKIIDYVNGGKPEFEVEDK